MYSTKSNIDLSKSRDPLKEALDIADALVPSLEKVLALNSVGRSYTDSGNPSFALGCHEKALWVAREIGDVYGATDARNGIEAAFRGLGSNRTTPFYET